MSTIRVEGVSKSYGDIQALWDVSFEVDDGEFVVLLGMSGAGKSTLLRCLNGLTTPTEGSVYVGGEEVTGPRDDVAMVFQNHNVIAEMSAYANALSGSLNRTPFLRSVLQWNDRDDKLDALRALETVGLLDEADQRTDRMSGGQRQRVGIARALVQQPTTLLADEPVASLDPASAETVMGYMKTAAKERGLTTIASLHQVNIAREFGDRFIGLHDGEVVFDGTEEELTMDVIDHIYGDSEIESLGGGKEVTA
jgi:phosphonate transport system ATP-binding protein